MGDKDDHATVYRDDVWLRYHPLTDRSVMMYFRHCATAFYDRMCNNEILYNRHKEPQPPDFVPKFKLDDLRDMRGIQYETVPCERHLIYLVTPSEFEMIRQQTKISANLHDLNMKVVETLNKYLLSRKEDMQNERETYLERREIANAIPSDVMDIDFVVDVLCRLRRLYRYQNGRFVVLQRLFLIRKISRQSPNEEKILANYYVLDGSIHQCPRVYSVLQSRLTIAGKHLNIAFKSILDDIDFDVCDGYTWRSFPSARLSKSFAHEDLRSPIETRNSTAATSVLRRIAAQSEKAN